jgi:methylamine dehydrogenase heavy chain
MAVCSSASVLRGMAFLIVCLLAPWAAIAAGTAGVPVEKAAVGILPDHSGKDWFWVWGNNAPSQVDGRALLFDGNGRNLGQLNTGFWPNNLIPSRKRSELYSVETYFGRGLRGQRTDVVTVYDGRTLSPLREIAIPPRRMNALGSTGLSVISDDERFLLVLNYTPAQSISVVNLAVGQFVTEFETPGCASIYPAGARDFYSICGDGSFLHVRLDDAGHPVLRQRTARMFDPVDDFLTTAASRNGSLWYFVSKQNNVYALQMTTAGVRRAARWSLTSAAERKDDWRISGVQHTALHRNSGRLFVLMHRGGPDTHQEPGTEVWVFDVKKQSRIESIKLEELSIAIGVSQGADPRLYSVDFFWPMPTAAKLWIYLTKGESELMKSVQQCITVYDAGDGEFLRRIDDLPPGYLSMVEPW